jgi:hypothetical protein
MRTSQASTHREKAVSGSTQKFLGRYARDFQIA